MGKVLKVDASVGDAFAQKDFTADHADVWVTISLAFDAAALAFWLAPGQAGGSFVELEDVGMGFLDSFGYATVGVHGEWSTSYASSTGAPTLTTETYHLIEFHHATGATSDLYVDGTLLVSGVDGSATDTRTVKVGAVFAVTGGANIAYIDNVKVGTTRGASDLFAEDFESGNLSAWSSTTGDVSVVDDPFVQPPTPTVNADLPVRIFITDKDSQTLSILDHRSTQRQFLFTLNNPAYHTGQVASDDNEINLPWPDADSPANLTNNRRLLWALQKWEGYSPPYQPIFGGIVTIAEDQGADAPTTRYTAHDPWQYMMSRPVRDPDTGALPGVDGLKFPDGALGSDIALALLETTQAVEGETHILFDTVFDSSPLVGGITFDQGTSVGEAWQQLCNTGTMDITLQPIYDPTVSPGKVCYFNVWPLNEGEAAGNILYDIVMAWDLPGHSLMTINRLVDGTRLANQIQFFAGQGGVPVNLQSDSASVAASGSYYSQQFFPGTQDRRLVTLLALAELEARKNGGRSITFDPAPERVEQPFKDYNLRDYLPVWASRNLREPLAVDYDSFDANNPGASGYQRIYAIPLNVDDNGVAIVTGLLTSKEN